jgi:hypothetical protein
MAVQQAAAGGFTGAMAGARPLPWPAAALVIGMLSTGLWLGLGWLAVTLL